MLLATSGPSPLSLHDALPIYRSARRRTGCLPRRSRARRRCGGGGLAEIAEDVVLGDAAGDTRPTDPRDVDVVFLRNLSYERDRKSTRLNSSHRCISYAVFCLK